MPSPAPEVHALAERYRIALRDVPTRGPAGERLGKAAGASLEFQDRRPYVPGDDVRHLDWQAYARTDQVMVRLYKEEVQPRVELVVDCSRSMAVDEDKARLAVDLASLLCASARAGGYHVRLVRAGDRAEVVSFDELSERGLELDGARTLQAGVDAALPLLRPGSVRVLVSDFLSPHDPSRLVRGFAGRGGGLALVQVLARADARPSAGEALRLTDAETGEHVDVVLDARTVERYLTRLARLQAGLAEEARRAGGRYVTMVAGPALGELCRSVLVPAGVLAPA